MRSRSCAEKHTLLCRETTHSVLKKSVKTKRVFLPKGKKIHSSFRTNLFKLFRKYYYIPNFTPCQYVSKTAHTLRTAEDVGPYNFCALFGENGEKDAKLPYLNPKLYMGTARGEERAKRGKLT